LIVDRNIRSYWCAVYFHFLVVWNVRFLWWMVNVCRLGGCIIIVL